MFVDAAKADFHLRKLSLAIDAGVESEDVKTDIDGQKRPAGTEWDLGAYAAPR